MTAGYLTLMLVTDPAMTAGRGLVETVLEAVAGGVTSVQLRDKTAGAEALLGQARTLRDHLAPLGIPLIVNDRPEVARAAGADGVHIGQDDGDPARIRDLMGPDAILGLSVTAAAEIATVDPGIVDYVGLGPIFATPTKADAAPHLGLPEAGAIGAALPVPWIGIGGIDAGNAARFAPIGAAGIACVSSICAAADPRAAAAAIRRALSEAEAA